MSDEKEESAGPSTAQTLESLAGMLRVMATQLRRIEAALMLIAIGEREREDVG